MSYGIDASRPYSGRHLLADIWGCKVDLTDRHFIEKVFNEGCVKSGATVLHTFSHPFPGGSSSGVLVLAESHASWHGWNERDNHMTIDIFMCGDCDPQVALDHIVGRLMPMRIITQMVCRGLCVYDVEKSVAA